MTASTPRPADLTPAAMQERRARRAAWTTTPAAQARVDADRARTPKAER